MTSSSHSSLADGDGNGDDNMVMRMMVGPIIVKTE